MNTNDEIAQLAKTFSTACKKMIEENKVNAYVAPMVMPAVVAALTVKSAAPQGLPWV